MKVGKTLISVLLSIAFLCTSASAANYNDTYGHWAGSDIERLAAAGIITGSGPAFYPENYVSRGQALDWIVRMANSGNVAGLFADAQNSYPVGIMGLNAQYDGIAALAVQSGILSGADVTNLNFSDPALRQEVFAWISRAVYLQPEFNDQRVMSRFSDAGLIDPLLVPYLIPLVRDGVVAGSAGSFYPRNAIKKGELASVLSRCTNRYVQPAGNRYGGPVSQTGKITALQTAIYPSQVTILNLDNVQHTLQVNSNSLLTKNGIASMLNQFMTGESVSYSADAAGNLLLLTSSSSLSQPPDPWVSYRNTHRGGSGNYTDGEVRSVNETRGELNLLTNSGGQRYTADPERFERKGSVYYIDDIRIRVGDEVRVYYTDDEIDSIELLDSWTHNADVVSEHVSVYKAKLDGYDSSNERLKLQSGTIRRWNGSSWVNVSGNMTLDCGLAGFYDYDGKHLALKNLRDYEDNSIYVLYDHDEEEVLTIRIMQGTELTRTDKVTEFSRDRLTLNDELRIYADYTASVVYKDTLYDIEDVEKDDRILVLYNRFNGENYAVIIGLNSGTGRDSDSKDQDPGEYVVYEGTISYTNNADYTISLTSIKKLEKGRLRSVSGSLELYAEDADYYYQGDKISWSELSRYEGYVLLALCDQDEEVYSLVIAQRKDFSSSASSRTGDVDRVYTNYFTLRNLDREFNVDDSTIIVENGYSIQYKSLYSNNEVFVVYENDGNDYRALLIEKLDYLY